MLLAEQGKLSVDDEITKFLPDYPTHGHRITVEHLLTHTSGIFSYTSIPGYMFGLEVRADLSTEDLVEVFADLEMDFSPGDGWNYSNSGYVLLGAIIEQVSGMPYSEYIREYLFEPLGMESSHYGGPQLIPGRVQGYAGTADSYSNALYLSMTQPHAAGSLLSNVDDLARWSAALFGGELLTLESVERMTRAHALVDLRQYGPNDIEGSYYAYGFFVSTFREEPMIFHGGGIHGFHSFSLWLPKSKIVVAVMSNSQENPVGPGYVAYAMAAEALGRPLPQHETTKPDEAVLASYVGVYASGDSNTVRITANGDRLQRYCQMLWMVRERIRRIQAAFFISPSTNGTPWMTWVMSL